ncbi:MAG: hypothetical protein ABW007_06400 [Chitinophagaceae bacterium]
MPGASRRVFLLLSEQSGFFRGFTSKTPFTFFCIKAKKVIKKDQCYALMTPPVFAGGQGAFFPRGLGDSVYFFCLDAKKVTKKNQGYAQMAKNGRVSPAQKKTRQRSV